MKKKISDPTRPEGFYYGYDSAADCMADYEANSGKQQTSNVEALAGYTCLWVFLAALVAVSIVAGILKW